MSEGRAPGWPGRPAVRKAKPLGGDTQLASCRASLRAEPWAPTIPVPPPAYDGVTGQASRPRASGGGVRCPQGSPRCGREPGCPSGGGGHRWCCPGSPAPGEAGVGVGVSSQRSEVSGVARVSATLGREVIGGFMVLRPWGQGTVLHFTIFPIQGDMRSPPPNPDSHPGLRMASSTPHGLWGAPPIPASSGPGLRISFV